MTPRPRLAPVLAAALALALAAGPARADGPAVIGEVKVEGNRRVEVDAIKAAVSKPGTPVDPRRLDADVRALMKLGFFKDVVIEQEGDPARPTLVVRVVERPTVREATIVGNDALSKDDLKDTVEIKPFTMLDLMAVRKDVQKIREKYVEKGYFLADVSYRLEDLPDNQVAIRYVVDEKAKVQVKEIRFIGNHQLSSAELRGVMLTQEGGWLSAFDSSGTYREDMFQRDVAVLGLHYMDVGYINVKVGKPAVSLSPDKRWLYVTIPIEEGEQYTVGDVSFSGDLLGEEERLKYLVQTKTGMLFSRTRITNDLTAAADVYKDRGYAYANVVPLTNLDPEKRIVHVTLEVQPGTLCRFERIEVQGNERTRDKVVRRELRIYEGQLFSAVGIKASKARVTALGFFETVEITTKKGSAEDLIVATVEVKEKSTGTFQLGAGFSSYENFVLSGQISQQNFFGWGQTLSLQVQWSSLRQLGQIQWVEPYFLDTRWTFAFDIYAQESTYTTFTRRSVGGNMTWGYELSGLAHWWPYARNLEDMRVFGTYTNEFVSVAGLGTGRQLFNQYRSGTTSSLRLSWQWDKRDNRVQASNGYFLQASAELAPPLLAPSWLFGEKVNLFTRWVAEARVYRPVAWGVVARGRLMAGLIDSWYASDPISISELYYVGGINTVRGYRYLSLAPTTLVPRTGNDPNSPLTQIATGGNKQLVINTELEFPMVGGGLRGLVFFDAGNTFATGAWTDARVPLSLYKSVGFGFRWTSPIGPLRFEWGIPLDRRRDAAGNYIDQKMDFQFTIGSFF